MTSLPSPDTVPLRPAGLRERRRERRRLAEVDRHAAHRAELVLLRSLLADAGELICGGWVQRCWFVVHDEDGARRRVGPRNLDDLTGRVVTDVCLVGAIVQAAGGVEQAGTQPVHRALDLTWATLRNEPVRWCPSPAVRLAHVHDMTRWNDQPGRTADDVSGLLALASDRATRDARSATPRR